MARPRSLLRFERPFIWVGELLGALGWIVFFALPQQHGNWATILLAGIIGAFLGSALAKLIVMIGLLTGLWR